MAWNLKQKAQDHIVLVLFGLITLLLLIVWRAIDSSVWDRVSAATPKRALWALLGLAGIAIGLLIGALIDSRRKRKNVPLAPRPAPAAPPEPRPLRRFGLLWDENQNPLCPADGTPLTFFTRHAADDSDILRCASCGSRVPIHHDTAGNLQLANAKQMIRDGWGD